jgi:hypothetical protein
MISRCHECALSIEEQKNYYVCQIRETIEKNPVIFFDGCPFFEPRDSNFELINLLLNNKDKNE